MGIRIPSFTLDLTFLIVIVTVISGLLAFGAKNSAAQNILAGISVSGLGAMALRLSQWTTEHAQNREFKNFFGRAALQGKMCLIYPDFTLSAEVSEVLRRVEFDSQKVFAKSAATFLRSHRIDIPNVVAMNDIEALLQVAIVLNTHSQKTPPIRADSFALENCDTSFISFGLSSNECTHMYLDCSGSPLFSIQQESESRRYGEYLEVSTPGRDARHFRSTDTHEIGIIVRHRPSGDCGPDTVWFLCAGLGPKGTVGAARYLASHWNELSMRVGQKDFLCLLCVATGYKHAELLLIVAGDTVIYEKNN